MKLNAKTLVTMTMKGITHLALELFSIIAISCGYVMVLTVAVGIAQFILNASGHSELITDFDIVVASAAYITALVSCGIAGRRIHKTINEMTRELHTRLLAVRSFV